MKEGFDRAELSHARCGCVISLGSDIHDKIDDRLCGDALYILQGEVAYGKCFEFFYRKIEVFLSHSDESKKSTEVEQIFTHGFLTISANCRCV